MFRGGTLDNEVCAIAMLLRPGAIKHGLVIRIPLLPERNPSRWFEHADFCFPHVAVWRFLYCFMCLPGKGHTDGAEAAYSRTCWEWLFC